MHLTILEDSFFDLL